MDILRGGTISFAPFSFSQEVKMEEKLLTAKEVADKLGLKLSTIYRWRWARRIPCVKVGAALRFRLSDIDRLIKEGFRPALREN